MAYVLQQPLDTWTPEALLPGNRMRDVALADLDGDGDLDLVHGDFDGGEVYWRQNDLDGAGAVLARVSIGSGIGGAQGLSIADIDGDSDLDVAVAGRSARTYFWLENTAGDAGAWTRHTITDGVNAAQVVVAADLDVQVGV
ncbi:MAG: FG-GAP-like repeat-containing protein, partial [Acidobacteriota bacterium]